MGRENPFFLKILLPNTVKGSFSTYHARTFLIKSLTKVNMEALEILDNVFLFSEIGKKYSSKKDYLYVNKYSTTILIDLDYAFLPYTIRQDNIKKRGSLFFLFRN